MRRRCGWCPYPVVHHRRLPANVQQGNQGLPKRLGHGFRRRVPVPKPVPMPMPGGRGSARLGVGCGWLVWVVRFEGEGGHSFDVGADGPPAAAVAGGGECVLWWWGGRGRGRVRVRGSGGRGAGVGKQAVESSGRVGLTLGPPWRDDDKASRRPPWALAPCSPCLDAPKPSLPPPPPPRPALAMTAKLSAAFWLRGFWGEVSAVSASASSLLDARAASVGERECVLRGGGGEGEEECGRR